MRLAVAVVMSFASVAQAEPGQRVVIPIDPPPAHAAAVSNVIYLERCTGSCRITSAGVNDAANNQSTIPTPGQYTVGEFKSIAGQTGALADAEWNMVVQCVREVYSPFDVTVTDQKPTSGVFHTAIVAGEPPQLGFDFTVLGVGLFASNCAPLDNVMSFAFSNAHNQDTVESRVDNICWTAAQEIAHSFGLDHQYDFVKDGRSACNDPMTYRFDCGGQKFFRNAFARCGELPGDGSSPRECRCSATQNSHKKLISVFGAGTPITAAPVVTMTNPPAGATALPANVIGQASSQRGVARVQLFLNGSPYLEIPGREFGPQGQSETAYGLLVPQDVPDSIYDVFVRAYDDLGAFTDSEARTVTKNAPCTATEACLAEQRCEAGRCLWDPPAGELGDDCTYPQFCKSFLCTGTADTKICTQSCEPADPEGCPAGLSCQSGVCYFAEPGGCCSTGGSAWLPAGLLAMIVGFVLRRRR